MPRPLRLARPAVLAVLAVTALLAPLLTPALTTPALAQLPGQPVPTQPDVVVEQLTSAKDPTALAVADDGRVVYAERRGGIRIWQQDGTHTLAGTILTEYTETNQAPRSEGGIHGLEISPDFADNGLIYVYYSVPGSLGRTPEPAKHPDAGGTAELEGVFRLSSFVLDHATNTLVEGSETVLFENPWEWYHCCHNGGDLDWMADGTMLLGVGDDTLPSESNGYTPIDGRRDPENPTDDSVHREAFDARRSSGNPADRRGKVLRIDVEDVDGDGSILPGDPTTADQTASDLAPNPHVGDDRYDPFVYAMGFRNPYRIAADPSGSVILGDVGPDAFVDDPNRGPAMRGEVEVIPPGGGTNHGWPYCIADNRPYIEYDFETGQSGEAFVCEDADGTPYTPAAIYYRGEVTPEFPTLAAGPATPMAGVTYDYEGDGALQLPPTIQGQHIFLEWSRQIAYTITSNADGTIGTLPVDIVPLAANLANPMDAAIGPDGAVYLLEYGRIYYNSPDAALSRIRCAACLGDPSDYGLPADTELFVGTRTGYTGGEEEDATADAARRGLSLTATTAGLALGVVFLRRRRTVL